MLSTLFIYIPTFSSWFEVGRCQEKEAGIARHRLEKKRVKLKSRNEMVKKSMWSIRSGKIVKVQCDDTYTAPISNSDSISWQNRPFGCKSICEARLHFQKDPKLEQARRIFKAWEMLANIPERVFKDEHPLKVGMPLRDYSKFDYFTPIIDAMNRTHAKRKSDDIFDVFSEIKQRKQRRREIDNPTDVDGVPLNYNEFHELALSERRKQQILSYDNRIGGTEGTIKLESSWRCPNIHCNNKYQSKCTTSEEGLVCICGIVVGTKIDTSDYRQKLGADECDDKTQRADAPKQTSLQKCDMDVIPSVRERREQRRGAERLTNVPARVKGYGKLWEARQKVDECNRKDSVTKAFDVTMTSYEDTKGWRIQEELQNIQIKLGNADPLIMREVRRVADLVWTRSVAHSRICSSRSGNDGCDLRLTERPAAVIAQAVFEYTIDQYSTGSKRLDGVATATVVDLKQHYNRKLPQRTPTAGGHMNLCKICVKLVHEAKNAHIEKCGPCAPACGFEKRSAGKKPITPFALDPLSIPSIPSIPSMPSMPSFLSLPSMSSIASDVSFQRSTESGGGESPIPLLVQYRDAISRVFHAHRSNLPLIVRDRSYEAIQTPPFIDAVEAKLHITDISAISFCILYAIKWCLEDERGGSESTPLLSALEMPEKKKTFDSEIASVLGLELDEAREAIQSIYQMDVLKTLGDEDDVLA